MNVSVVEKRCIQAITPGKITSEEDMFCTLDCRRMPVVAVKLSKGILPVHGANGDDVDSHNDPAIQLIEFQP